MHAAKAHQKRVCQFPVPGMVHWPQTGPEDHASDAYGGSFHPVRAQGQKPHGRGRLPKGLPRCEAAGGLEGGVWQGDGRGRRVLCLPDPRVPCSHDQRTSDRGQHPCWRQAAELRPPRDGAEGVCREHARRHDHGGRPLLFQGPPDLDHEPGLGACGGSVPQRPIVNGEYFG